MAGKDIALRRISLNMRDRSISLKHENLGKSSENSGLHQTIGIMLLMLYFLQEAPSFLITVDETIYLSFTAAGT